MNANGNLNIALVTYAIEIGGVETMLRALATGLKNQGHNITFVETQSKGAWSDQFRQEGFNVITVAQQAWRSRVAHAQRIAHVLADSHAVILHDAPYAQSVLGLLPAHTVAIPVLHNALPTMIENATANPTQFDTLVGVSPAMCDAAIQFSDIEPSRVHCIPNGVDVPQNNPKQNATFNACPNNSNNPLQVIFIGRVDHNQKGVRHLPGIMRRVKQFGVNAHLHVVGDGPDLPALRALAQDPSADPINATFHGALEHEHAMRLLQSSDALIMPSYFEGLPITLLETMARGVVPVVSNLPACTDYTVTNNIDGCLIEPGDEAAFAQALARLGADPDARRAMSHAAWNTAQKRFSAQAMSNAYLKLIRNSQHAKQQSPTHRSDQIQHNMLGDFPRLPISAIRPLRKIKRLRGAA